MKLPGPCKWSVVDVPAGAVARHYVPASESGHDFGLSCDCSPTATWDHDGHVLLVYHNLDIRRVGVPDALPGEI